MTPTRVRYRVVGFALTLAILSYIQRVAISQAAGPIAHDLKLDKQQLGSVLGAFGLAYAAFEIPMGLYGDKKGVRRVLGQIVIAWSFFTALTGAAWNMTSLWVIRFLFGAGEAGCFPNLTRMLSQWLPRRERIRAQALMWASTRWGGAVTPPLALLGITLFGWRLSFVAFALLGVIWAVWFLARFRENPADDPAVNEAELALLQESHRMVTQHQGHWLRVLLQPQVLLLMCQYFCWSYIWYFFVTWLPTYLSEAQGQSAAATAGFAVLPLLFGGFGSIVSGLLPLHLPRRWIAAGCYVVVLALLLLLPTVHGVGPAIAIMAAISFFGDVTMPISWNACVEIGRRYTATVGAAMNMFANFSGFVAPFVGGYILKHYDNDWARVLHVMAAFAAIGAFLWLFIDPTGERANRRDIPADLQP
ncbi:MFS transporter [Sphingomonas nostoxanthinifaciens]|uniref:MFS transporter n=1 Tax=Sphingomonas nostoxanthinifaciens TaxID=2872652 RepID=UPI001CC1D80B|nr:MFS transporter [Sphingomonas nostoxanthinifaciens]UAK24773.1 MFS transporter [Sphingomonas nostoxanthinifaciens]